MEKDCGKHWRLGMYCHPVAPLPQEREAVGLGCAPAPSQAQSAGPGSIVFAADRRENPALIPGYNAIAPHIKTVRDPALSLIALSGIDHSEPVMVEVPLVLNNTTFTASELLSGWRIGFADRYVYGDHVEPVEHSVALRRVFECLRQAGVQWVPVAARRDDHTLKFNLRRNEIDQLVSEYRLDALVSEDESVAFHGACTSAHASICEPLDDGTKLWIYGAQWSANTLPRLLCAYRQMSAGVSGPPG